MRVSEHTRIGTLCPENVHSKRTDGGVLARLGARPLCDGPLLQRYPIVLWRTVHRSHLKNKTFPSRSCFPIKQCDTLPPQCCKFYGKFHAAPSSLPLFPPSRPLLRTPSRLWTSATLVAAKHSSRSQERPPSHHGVRCSRCGTGPVVGSCYRCAAGCLGGGGGGVASARGRQKSRPALQSPGEMTRRDERQRSGCGVSNGSSSSSRGSKPGGRSAERGGDGGGGGGGAGGWCYTLCEACFRERRQFHPPHPFARLRAGFAEPRLSGPVLYEAV